mgnify:CR=1 FL=1
MLNELSKEINDNAVSHGWWDEPRNLLEIAALCHSELSEAVEEYRAGRPMAYVNMFDGETVYYGIMGWQEAGRNRGRNGRLPYSHS